MEFFQDLTVGEREIRKIADAKKIPIAGTFELLPLCNMDCRMCYVKMNKQEMLAAGGRMRSAEEWIKLGKQAVANGMMFLLITGGEPFLYPDFVKVYNELRNMGLVIMINTNCTLLTDEILQAFIKNKPRRLNISLYGSSDEVYGNLCRNPKGFTQLMHNIKLLQENDISIRFNMAITPWNKDDFPNMIKIANELNIPTSIANYIFPAERRNLTIEESSMHRFCPEKAAIYGLEISRLHNTPEEIYATAKDRLHKIENPELPTFEQPHGFWCRGGLSSFWVTWDHRMTPCGMVQDPAIQIENSEFLPAWQSLRAEMQKIYLSSECFNCEKRSICQTCAASMKGETGSFDKKPEYHCKMVDSLIEECRKIVKEYEQ